MTRLLHGMDLTSALELRTTISNLSIHSWCLSYTSNMCHCL